MNYFYPLYRHLKKSLLVPITYFLLKVKTNLSFVYPQSGIKNMTIILIYNNQNIDNILNPIPHLIIIFCIIVVSLKKFPKLIFSFQWVGLELIDVVDVFVAFLRCALDALRAPVAV